MTNHPLTPPPELVKQWREAPEFSALSPCVMVTVTNTKLQDIATQAARWGADQELEACCALMDDWGLDGEDLMQCRRPKPQTLNSIALQMLGTIERDGHYIPEITDTIRRALEQLDD